MLGHVENEVCANPSYTPYTWLGKAPWAKAL